MPEIQGPIQSLSQPCSCKSNQSNLHVQVNPNAVNGPVKLQSHFQVSSQAMIARKNTKGITMALPKTLCCKFSSWWIGFSPPLSPHQRVANLDPWAPLPCGFSLSWKRLKSLTMLHCSICAVSSDKHDCYGMYMCWCKVRYISAESFSYFDLIFVW